MVNPFPHQTTSIKSKLRFRQNPKTGSFQLSHDHYHARVSCSKQAFLPGQHVQISKDRFTETHKSCVIMVHLHIVLTFPTSYNPLSFCIQIPEYFPAQEHRKLHARA